MTKFNNPLDNIHVASPCPANWEEMYGNDRKRHCGECKLNVYSLSDMTRREAENLLVNSEGRLCVRYFRRADGTVLTKNCPVGWKAAKQRVSHFATAAFSMIAGLFGGIFAFNIFRDEPAHATVGVMAIPDDSTVMGGYVPHPVVGEIEVGNENEEWKTGEIMVEKSQTVKPKIRRNKTNHE